MTDLDFDTRPCGFSSCAGALGTLSFYAGRGATCWGHQGDDGQAHLAYYLADRGLSFIWNGSASTVEVHIGGYGEPVFVRFVVEPTGSVNPRGFAAACDAWAARHPETCEERGAVA